MLSGAGRPHWRIRRLTPQRHLGPAEVGPDHSWTEHRSADVTCELVEGQKTFLPKETHEEKRRKPGNLSAVDRAGTRAKKKEDQRGKYWMKRTKWHLEEKGGEKRETGEQKGFLKCQKHPNGHLWTLKLTALTPPLRAVCDTGQGQDRSTKLSPSEQQHPCLCCSDEDFNQP